MMVKKRRTAKSMLFEFCELDPVTDKPESYIHNIAAVDMGFIWYLATQDCEARKRNVKSIAGVTTWEKSARS